MLFRNSFINKITQIQTGWLLSTILLLGQFMSFTQLLYNFTPLVTYVDLVGCIVRQSMLNPAYYGSPRFDTVFVSVTDDKEAMSVLNK